MLQSAEYQVLFKNQFQLGNVLSIKEILPIFLRIWHTLFAQINQKNQLQTYLVCQFSISMSKLLQQFQSISCLKEPIKQCNHHLAHKIMQKLKKLKNLWSSTNVQFDGDSLITVNIHQPCFSDLRDLVMVLKIDLKGRTIKVKGFFCKNLLITFTGSRNLSMSFFGKNLQKLNSYSEHKIPIIMIQKGLGQISIMSSQSFTQKFLEQNQMIDFFKQKISFLVCQVKPRLKNLLKNLNLLPSSYDKIEQRNRQNSEVQEQNLLSKIAQYINMSIIPNIDRKISVQNQIVTQRPEYSILKMLIQSQKTWKIEKNCKLFGYIPQDSMKFKRYEISAQDQKIFESRFQKPSGKSNKQGQNKFLFNYIHIPDELVKDLKLKNCRKVMVRKGGFCIVYVFQSLKFHYIETVQAIAENQRSLLDKSLYRAPKGELQKHICIKLPNQNQSSQSRIEHQIQIVKRFKGASSSYMFKYYVTTQKNFQYRNKLFFDYIGEQTLFDLLNLREQTLSMHSRLLIAINVAQGLRFLDQYHIAHLDLKPGNIFVFKDFRVKIFDFSESYHKEVCKKDRSYRPGYSLPYSSPEVFSQKNKYEYTIRSDIYSLGILMLRLFFRNQYVNFSKVIKYYQVKQYFNHFFFNTQGLECYTSYKILNNLASLILKCLHPDVEKRPYPTWIIIILAQIIKLFQ